MIGSRSRPALADRRAIASRNAAWARALSLWLASLGVRPNAISMAGVVFAMGAGAAFYFAPDLGGDARVGCLVIAAAGIQLRLLCNLLDGMLAVEHGLQTRTGPLWNDCTDRLADVIILVGAGYATRDIPHGPELGWLTAVLAVTTAYVRVLGGSLRLTQRFNGVMAKPQRMFTLTVAALLSAGEAAMGQGAHALAAGLLVICVGSFTTAVRRVQGIARELEAQ